MFELIAIVFGLGIVAQVVFWVFAGLLFPLFWLWMVIDAVLRTEGEYPSGGSNEKIVWILAMVFMQFVSIVYFFVVFRRVRRGSAAVSSQPPMAPPTPYSA